MLRGSRWTRAAAARAEAAGLCSAAGSRDDDRRGLESPAAAAGRCAPAGRNAAGRRGSWHLTSSVLTGFAAGGAHLRAFSTDGKAKGRPQPPPAGKGAPAKPAASAPSAVANSPSKAAGKKAVRPWPPLPKIPAEPRLPRHQRGTYDKEPGAVEEFENVVDAEEWMGVDEIPVMWNVRDWVEDHPSSDEHDAMDEMALRPRDELPDVPADAPPYPGATQLLRYTTHMVLAAGSDQAHPLNTKVVLEVTVTATAREAALDSRAVTRLLALAGPRYDPGSDTLTLVSRKYPDRESNRRHCAWMLTHLIRAARDASDAGLALEAEEAALPRWRPRRADTLAEVEAAREHALGVSPGSARVTALDRRRAALRFAGLVQLRDDGQLPPFLAAPELETLLSLLAGPRPGPPGLATPPPPGSPQFPEGNDGLESPRGFLRGLWVQALERGGAAAVVSGWYEPRPGGPLHPQQWVLLAESMGRTAAIKASPEIADAAAAAAAAAMADRPADGAAPAASPDTDAEDDRAYGDDGDDEAGDDPVTVYVCRLPGASAQLLSELGGDALELFAVACGEDNLARQLGVPVSSLPRVYAAASGGPALTIDGEWHEGGSDDTVLRTPGGGVDGEDDVIVMEGFDADGADVPAALLAAAFCGDVSQLRRALAAGAPVDHRMYAGVTSLHLACGVRHLGCIRALVESGADVNAADDDGDTALHYAAKMDQPAAVTLLLEAGARHDAANKQGDTPLVVATRASSTAVVALLTAARDAKGGDAASAPGGDAAAAAPET